MATYPPTLDEVKFVRLYAKALDWLAADAPVPDGATMNPLTVPWKAAKVAPDLFMPEVYADWAAVAAEDFPIPPGPELNWWSVEITRPVGATTADVLYCTVGLTHTDSLGNVTYPEPGELSVVVELWFGATDEGGTLVQTITPTEVSDQYGQFYTQFDPVGVGLDGAYHNTVTIIYMRIEGTPFDVVEAAPP